MKALHFHATAGHPKVAPALASQTEKTLRPFHRYLRQAIRTAKERQYRYQLSWERVRHLRTIRLEPVDSLLRIPRRAPGLVITNWPPRKLPDLSQQAFLINAGQPVWIETATTTSQGLMVHASPAVTASDRLIWCGVECAFRQDDVVSPPPQVTDMAGRPLRLIGDPEPLGEHHWLLVVESRHGDCHLNVDGEKVEAEALPALEGLRRVIDTEGRSFEIIDGVLRTDELPARGHLRGDTGVRFNWQSDKASGRQGKWVQLLSPETSEGEDFLDPRTAFCEGDVKEVWTAKSRRPDDVYKVLKVDQDRYQLLLDRMPPPDTTLLLPIEVRNLHLQRRALHQLTNAPLPHHRGLLRLCEDPGHVRWPAVRPEKPVQWRWLTDETRSGTLEQRDFVTKALGTPDFAFLEGPPGSGKTTAICEIVQQLVEKGERVLLCASTHVAIDNVLERLRSSDTPIDAVRIGRPDRVDERVQDTQLDVRVEKLVTGWRSRPELRQYSDDDLASMALRTIIMAANLTCGTTMGIVNHPLFRGRDENLHISECPITRLPHWDVLIVDEASKTLIQEFLVPALMAKRWIIVGDVRQLPPFADRADIVANLRDLVNEKDRPIFPRDRERPKATRVPRSAQDGRVGSEAVSAYHEHGDAPLYTGEPDERGALVWPGRWVLGGDPARVGRGVILLLKIHSELEAVPVMRSPVVAFVVDPVKQRPHGVAVTHRAPRPPLHHAIDQFVHRHHRGLLSGSDYSLTISRVLEIAGNCRAWSLAAPPGVARRPRETKARGSRSGFAPSCHSLTHPGARSPARRPGCRRQRTPRRAGSSTGPTPRREPGRPDPPPRPRSRPRARRGVYR